MKKEMIYFDQNFIEVCHKAQENAKRLGIIRISDILLLKELLYAPTSYMAELVKITGLPWKKVRRAIDEEVMSFVKKEKETFGEIKGEEQEDEKVSIQEDGTLNMTFHFDENLIYVVSNSMNYTLDQQTVNEIAFILTLMDSGSEYCTNFFNKIQLDTILITRYYEGLEAEVASEEYYNGSNTNNLGQQEEELSEEEEAIENALDEYYSNQDKEETENVKQEGKLVIPKRLSSYVKVMSAASSEESPILGRDKETEALTKILLKYKKGNCILIGEAGVGKTAIVEHLAWLIANDKCAEGLKGKTILSLEVNGLIAGTTLRGMAEERFKLVADFLANRNDVILFIDEIHTAVGAGTSKDDSNDFSNALKPLLEREGISVIGATTDKEYNRVFSKDPAFKRRFEKLVVKEPKYEEVYSMIKLQIKNLTKFHGISITRHAVDFIIKVSGCFNFETNNPDRTIDLIDKAMATAKMEGVDTVTKEIVMKNFDANFKLYEKMDYDLKMSTAYHEMGHFLLSRYSKNLSKRRTLAVSIIPAGEYLGITTQDTADDNLIEWNYETYIDRIAMLLAGRKAESMYTGYLTSGAGNDLKRATQIARSMLTEYGFKPTYSKRNTEGDLTEKKTNNLNEEIDKIIEEANNKAKTVLDEHKELLKALAEEIVKTGILMESELDAICKIHERKQVFIEKPEVSSN